MTKPPAGLAMNALAEVIRQAVPNVAPNAAVPTVMPIEVRTVVPIEEREAVQIARDSVVVVRCWRRTSRGCPSRRSPRA